MGIKKLALSNATLGHIHVHVTLAKTVYFVQLYVNLKTYHVSICDDYVMETLNTHTQKTTLL